MPQKSLLLLSAVITLALGCAGPGKQVAQIQSEKQELISTIEAEKKAKEALQQKAASLESRLDESEKEIARLTGRKGSGDDGIRSASSKNLSLPADEARSEGQSPPGNDGRKPFAVPLPWKKTGAGAAESKPAPMSLKAPAEAGGAARISSEVNTSLRSIAERDSRLQYDPSTDTARYQLDIEFEENGAGLTGEGRKRLDDLASWLKAEPTKDLRVLVSGSSTGMKKPEAGDEKPRFANDRQLGAARAGAVADYLDRHGITADRLVVLGTGGPSRGLEDTSGTPVQIHLAESTAPILGIVPKTPTLRR